MERYIRTQNGNINIYELISSSNCATLGINPTDVEISLSAAKGSCKIVENFYSTGSNFGAKFTRQTAQWAIVRGWSR